MEQKPLFSFKNINKEDNTKEIESSNIDKSNISHNDKNDNNSSTKSNVETRDINEKKERINSSTNQTIKIPKNLSNLLSKKKQEMELKKHTDATTSNNPDIPNPQNIHTHNNTTRSNIKDKENDDSNDSLKDIIDSKLSTNKKEVKAVQKNDKDNSNDNSTAGLKLTVTNYDKDNSSNANTKIDLNNFSNNTNENCVMNRMSIFKANTYYKVKVCKDCELNYICESCYETCHLHDETQILEKTMDITANIVDHPCSCALNRHIVKKKIKSKDSDNLSNYISSTEIENRSENTEFQQSIQPMSTADPTNSLKNLISNALTNSKSTNKTLNKSQTKIDTFFNKTKTTITTCPINSFLLQSKQTHYFLIKNTNQMICLYCILTCKNCSTTEITKNFDMIPIKDYHLRTGIHKLSEAEYHEATHCRCEGTHNKRFILNAFTLILENDYFNEFLIVKRLPGVLLQSKYTHFMFWPIELYHKKLEQAIDNNDYNIYHSINSQHSVYFHSLNVLVAVSRYDREMLSMEKEFLEKHINITFLIKLLSTKFVPHDKLFYLKVNLMKIYRKLIIVPKLKSNINMYFDNEKNTNFFHREIFKLSINQFFSDSGVSEQSLKDILDSLYKNCIGYYSLKNGKDLKVLVKEYFKWVEMLLDYKCSFFDDVLNKLADVVITIQGNSEFSSMIEYYENIIRQYFIHKNDEVAINFVMNNCVNSNNEVSINILDKSNTEDINFSKINGGIINTNTDYNKSKGNNNIKSTDPAKLKFAFEKSPLSEKLLQTFFSFTKAQKYKYEEYTSSESFYNILITKTSQDYFSTELQKIILSSNLYLSKEKLNILLLPIEQALNHKEIISLLTQENIMLINSIISVFNTIINLYNLNEQQKMKEEILKLKLFYDDFIIIIQPILYSKHDFFKQLIIVKAGLLEVILNCIEAFTDNCRENRSYFTVIFKYLNIIVFSNPFICSLFFSKKIIQLLLMCNTEGHELILDMLKCLKKNEYNVDAVELLEEMFCFNISEYSSDFIISFLKNFSFIEKMDMSLYENLFASSNCNVNSKNDKQVTNNSQTNSNFNTGIQTSNNFFSEINTYRNSNSQYNNQIKEQKDLHQITISTKFWIRIFNILGLMLETSEEDTKLILHQNIAFLLSTLYRSKYFDSFIISYEKDLNTRTQLNSKSFTINNKVFNVFTNNLNNQNNATCNSNSGNIKNSINKKLLYNESLFLLKSDFLLSYINIINNITEQTFDFFAICIKLQTLDNILSFYNCLPLSLRLSISQLYNRLLFKDFFTPRIIDYNKKWMYEFLNFTDSDENSKEFVGGFKYNKINEENLNSGTLEDLKFRLKMFDDEKKNRLREVKDILENHFNQGLKKDFKIFLGRAVSYIRNKIKMKKLKLKEDRKKSTNEDKGNINDDNSKILGGSKDTSCCLFNNNGDLINDTVKKILFDDDIDKKDNNDTDSGDEGNVADKKDISKNSIRKHDEMDLFDFDKANKVNRIDDGNESDNNDIDLDNHSHKDDGINNNITQDSINLKTLSEIFSSDNKDRNNKNNSKDNYKDSTTPIESANINTINDNIEELSNNKNNSTPENDNEASKNQKDTSNNINNNTTTNNKASNKPTPFNKYKNLVKKQSAKLCYDSSINSIKEISHSSSEVDITPYGDLFENDYNTNTNANYNYNKLYSDNHSSNNFNLNYQKNNKNTDEMLTHIFNNKSVDISGREYNDNLNGNRNYSASPHKQYYFNTNISNININNNINVINTQYTPSHQHFVKLISNYIKKEIGSNNNTNITNNNNNYIVIDDLNNKSRCKSSDNHSVISDYKPSKYQEMREIIRKKDKIKTVINNNAFTHFELMFSNTIKTNDNLSDNNLISGKYSIAADMRKKMRLGGDQYLHNTTNNYNDINETAEFKKKIPPVKFHPVLHELKEQHSYSNEINNTKRDNINPNTKLIKKTDKALENLFNPDNAIYSKKQYELEKERAERKPSLNNVVDEALVESNEQLLKKIGNSKNANNTKNYINDNDDDENKEYKRKKNTIKSNKLNSLGISKYSNNYSNKKYSVNSKNESDSKINENNENEDSSVIFGFEHSNYHYDEPFIITPDILDDLLKLENDNKIRDSKISKDSKNNEENEKNNEEIDKVDYKESKEIGDMQDTTRFKHLKDYLMPIQQKLINNENEYLKFYGLNPFVNSMMKFRTMFRNKNSEFRINLKSPFSHINKRNFRFNSLNDNHNYTGYNINYMTTPTKENTVTPSHTFNTISNYNLPLKSKTDFINSITINNNNNSSNTNSNPNNTNNKNTTLEHKIKIEFNYKPTLVKKISLVKYFNKLTLDPFISFFYKIIMFSDNSSINIYLLFKTFLLFLKCFDFFLSSLLDKRLKLDYRSNKTDLCDVFIFPDLLNYSDRSKNKYDEDKDIYSYNSNNNKQTDNMTSNLLDRINQMTNDNNLNKEKEKESLLKPSNNKDSPSTIIQNNFILFIYELSKKTKNTISYFESANFTLNLFDILIKIKSVCCSFKQYNETFFPKEIKIETKILEKTNSKKNQVSLFSQKSKDYEDEFVSNLFILYAKYTEYDKINDSNPMITLLNNSPVESNFLSVVFNDILSKYKFTNEKNIKLRSLKEYSNDDINMNNNITNNYNIINIETNSNKDVTLKPTPPIKPNSNHDFNININSNSYNDLVLFYGYYPIFSYENNNIINILIQIFSSKPKQFQELALNYPNFSKLFHNLFLVQLPYLYQIPLFEFLKTHSTQSNSIKIIKLTLNFLKLLVMGQNLANQSLVINSLVFKDTKFLDFLFWMANKIFYVVDFSIQKMYNFGISIPNIKVKRLLHVFSDVNVVLSKLIDKSLGFNMLLMIENEGLDYIGIVESYFNSFSNFTEIYSYTKDDISREKNEIEGKNKKDDDGISVFNNDNNYDDMVYFGNHFDNALYEDNKQIDYDVKGGLYSKPDIKGANFNKTGSNLYRYNAHKMLIDNIKKASLKSAIPGSFSELVNFSEIEENYYSIYNSIAQFLVKLIEQNTANKVVLEKLFKVILPRQLYSVSGHLFKELVKNYVYQGLSEERYLNNNDYSNITDKRNNSTQQTTDKNNIRLLNNSFILQQKDHIRLLLKLRYDRNLVKDPKYLLLTKILTLILRLEERNDQQLYRFLKNVQVLHDSNKKELMELTINDNKSQKLFYIKQNIICFKELTQLKNKLVKTIEISYLPFTNISSDIYLYNRYRKIFHNNYFKINKEFKFRYITEFIKNEVCLDSDEKICFESNSNVSNINIDDSNDDTNDRNIKFYPGKIHTEASHDGLKINIGNMRISSNPYSNHKDFSSTYDNRSISDESNNSIAKVQSNLIPTEENKTKKDEKEEDNVIEIKHTHLHYRNSKAAKSSINIENDDDDNNDISETTASSNMCNSKSIINSNTSIKTKIKKLYFSINPKSLYLEDSDIEEIVENSCYDSCYSKLYYSLECYPSLLENLSYKQYLEKIGFSLDSYLIITSFNDVKYISILFSIIINILLIISVTTVGSPNTNTNVVSSSESGFYFPLKYQIDLVVILHVVFLLYVLLAFIHSIYLNKMSILNMKKNKLYQLAHLRSKDIMIYIKDKLIKTSKTTYFIYWNLTFSVLGLLNPKMQFLYCLLLFILYIEISTMHIVIVSIKLKYKQFLASLLFIFALTLFFSTIAFLFFNDSYLIEDENTNEKINVCENIFSCFTYFIHNGIRGGLGFNFTNKSYNDQGYLIEMILEWLFYFSILLVMLNIINGIIVDTFEEMRVKEAEKYEFKRNCCYICSLNKSEFEINSLSFHNHTSRDHCVGDYYHYLIYLDSLKQDDMTNKDDFIQECLKNNLLDFFPIERSLKLDNNTK